MTTKQLEKMHKLSEQLQMQLSTRLTEQECKLLNEIIELEIAIEAECNK